MQITLKLFAQLGQYLPPQTARNEVAIEIGDGSSIWHVLDAYNVPRGMCHLVMVNGHAKAVSLRDGTVLKPGDVLAAWPPIAGG